MRRAAFVLIVAAGAGCNGGGSSPDRRAEAEAVERFCLQFWAKRAARVVSCTGMTEEEANRPAAIACAGYKAAALEGGLELDGERVAGCLAAVDVAGCSLFGIADVRACNGTLVGRRVTGGRCRLHLAMNFDISECRTGDFCLADLTTGQCGGRCEPLRREGESCSGRGCAEHLRCREGLCREVVPVGVGESCVGPPESPGAPCAEGLDCVGLGICRRRHSLPSCTSDADCEDFKNCVSGSCMPNLDGPCTGGTQTGCAMDRVCIEGRCAVRRGIGDACPSGDLLACVPGAFCAAGACQRRPREGEACVGGPYCGLSLCVDGLECQAGLCVRPPALGESCDVIDPVRCCAVGQACMGGRCAAVDLCY